MKRSTLLYSVLTIGLFAGLAHLRADWLGGASDYPEPAARRTPDRVVTSTAWALRQNEVRGWQSFLRQP